MTAGGLEPDLLVAGCKVPIAGLPALPERPRPADHCFVAGTSGSQCHVSPRRIAELLERHSEENESPSLKSRTRIDGLGGELASLADNSVPLLLNTAHVGRRLV